MPVLKHAKKKLRQDKKRTFANKRLKETYRKLVKAAKATKTKEAVSGAFQAIDKATKHNLMHKNKAARMKSSLSKLLVAGSEKKVATEKVVKKETPKKVVKKPVAKAKKKATK